MKIAEHTVNNEDEAAEPVEESEATS
jgi:hypothetical protein